MRGGTDNGKMHLQAASAIIPVLIDAHLSLPLRPESEFPVAAGALSQNPFFKTDEAAIKILITIFLWFDIYTCISSGSKPYLESYFQRLLESPDGGIDMGQVMGCENSIMIQIGKIASLDVWKRESQKSGKLSVVNLVKQATQIEQDLKSGLAEAQRKAELSPQFPGENTSIPLATISNPSKHIHLANLSIYSNYVTQINAMSALTYLHVVVSGPQPESPEIRETVRNTIDALRNIPHPQLVRAMQWPILVSGSMALEEEEPFFRQLICGSGVVSETAIGLGWNILKILEQCWRTRGNNEFELSGEGHWASVIASIGIQVVVV